VLRVTKRRAATWTATLHALYQEAERQAATEQPAAARLVIARKIGGGTRSPEGSRTQLALAALCATWLAQGRDPCRACRQPLAAQSR
jgi:hypothetical protein